MLDTEAFIQFVNREREAALGESGSSNRRNRQDLLERGEAVDELELRERRGAGIWMTCPENLSRFRPGSRVLLQGTTAQFLGEVVDIDDGGTGFHFRLENAPNEFPAGPWLATEAEVDLSPLVLRCLQMLQPGAPGWTFCKALLGDSAMHGHKRKSGHTRDPTTIIEDTIRGTNLEFDATQWGAIAACVSQPPFLAVHGPPGTGKTVVLAVVAEILARLGRRVLITAPTHQAINNALAAVHRLFRQRLLVKVGDEIHREGLPDQIRCTYLNKAIQSSLKQEGSPGIIGMTFLSALQNVVARRSGFAPNVLLIDEASQLPLAQGACSGLVGAGSLVLFGDDAQMPPVFPAGVKEDPLAVSLFAQFRREQRDSICVLETTYRMNAEICNVVRSSFYEESAVRLKPSSEAANRLFNLPIQKQASQPNLIEDVLSATSSFVWVKTRNSDCRQFNLLEAEFFADLVATAIERGLPSGAIAVVTPCRLQSARIRNLIRSRLGPMGLATPIVDTVERVQGLSVDLVAISLCASDPKYVGELASFLYSPNRINVAMSRARKKIVLAVTPEVLTTSARHEAGQQALTKLASVLAQATSTFDLI